MSWRETARVFLTTEPADRHRNLCPDTLVIAKLQIASANAFGDGSAAESPSRFEVNYVRVCQKQEHLLR